MYAYQRDVLAYHAKFSCIIGNVKTPRVVNGPFRATFIEEETREFREALETDDAVEMADALCDLLYIVIGTAIEFGIDLALLFPRFDEGTKPDPTMHLLDNKKVVIGSFELAAKQCREAIESEAVDACALALYAAANNVRAAVKAWGIDLRPLWAEVHRTNMLKVPSGAPDKKTIKPPGWKRPDLGPILAEQYGLAPSSWLEAANDNTPAPTGRP